MRDNLKHKTLPAQIYNLKFWVRAIEPKALKTFFDQLLSKTKFNVLNFSDHHFPIQGYTAIWLLAESHLAIHTFPQDGWSYVELSGCNEAKTHLFKKLLNTLSYEITWENHDIRASIPQPPCTKINTPAV